MNILFERAHPSVTRRKIKWTRRDKIFKRKLRDCDAVRI